MTGCNQFLDKEGLELLVNHFKNQLSALNDSVVALGEDVESLREALVSLQDPFLTITNADGSALTTLDVEAAGGEVTVMVTANYDWSISGSGMTFSVDSGDKWVSTEVTISLDNSTVTTAETRTATVTLKGGVLSENIEIEQAGLMAYLVDEDGVTYAIDDVVAFEKASRGGNVANQDVVSKPSAVTFDSDGEEVTLTRSTIAEVHLQIPMNALNKNGITGSGYYTSRFNCLFCNYKNCSVFDVHTVGEIYWEEDNKYWSSRAFGAAMFYNCTALTELPDDFVIPSFDEGGILADFMLRAFQGCTSLTKLPKIDWSNSSVTGGEIMYRACYGCTALTDISEFKLPVSSSSIGTYFLYQTFYGCTALESISLTPPPDATTIGTYFLYQTFYGCTALTDIKSLTIPQGITTANTQFLSGTFYGCTALTDISNITIPQGIEGSTSSFLRETFRGCTSLSDISSIIIPDGITDCGDYFLAYTFYQTAVSDASNIKMPSGLADITEVGSYFLAYTFSTTNVTTLEHIKIPEKLETVGSHFLAGYLQNLSITDFSWFSIPQGITSVGNSFLQSTFYGCTSLTSAPAIPQGITSVGSSFLWYTFYGCTSLSDISALKIPSGITGSVSTYFMSRTFQGCSSITDASSIEIPQGITSVSTEFMRSTFSGCTKLATISENLTLPQGITTMTASHFLYCTFQNCKALKYLPSGFRLLENLEIQESAPSSFMVSTFYGCSGLKQGTEESGAKLYFAYAGTNTFSNTSVTPTSPSQGEWVYVACETSTDSTSTTDDAISTASLDADEGLTLEAEEDWLDADEWIAFDDADAPGVMDDELDGSALV